mgnify:CR=1 FL=1
MWQRSANLAETEALELNKAPSLRKRFILAGSAVITVIALIAVNLVFNYSQRLADLSYDRLLLSALLQMDENILAEEGRVSIDIPWSAFSTLAQANEDRIFYRVESSIEGYITGNKKLISTPPIPSQLGKPQFYNQTFSGEMVRLVWLERAVTEGNIQGTVTIILGQTRLSRETMASSITTRAIQVILIIAIVAIVLIMLGSHLVLRPLHRIEDLLEERQPGDLTPIRLDTPKETYQLKVALNHFMARLNKNLEQLENYTAESAHQLRTPLASLKALAENARDQTTPQKQQQALEQIVQQSETLSNTVTLLLNQAVVSHRLQTQNLMPLDLVELMKQSCMENAVTALRQGIHLSFEADAKKMMIVGDAFSLQQMLNNLIDNAVRYSAVPENKAENQTHTEQENNELAVDIRLIQKENRVILSVIDYGEGIPDEAKKRVFERFYRANYEISGTGVGLAMVKEISDRHHANVSVQDSVPSGATIRVDFPLFIEKEERL